MTNEDSKREQDRAVKLLEGAYAIKTAEDNVEYYRDFADIYDREFADRMGYIYPAMLASVYQQHARTADIPIADIGCGTGLVAEALQNHSANTIPIDGIDISQDMLDAAESKSLYQNLYLADLSKKTDNLPDNYGAVVSAGTFTFGHLGPASLRDLLQLGRSGTLYCIGVNTAYFKEQGFPEVIGTLHRENLITEPVIEVKKMYNPPAGSKAIADHAEDTSSVLVYRQV